MREAEGRAAGHAVAKRGGARPVAPSTSKTATLSWPRFGARIWPPVGVITISLQWLVPL